ncbi:MAG: hypothetical protein K2Z81_16330 [Cyanobacteria bacterium]|nr:hypothetical protein [Cyanobacteriota bacterium]
MLRNYVSQDETTNRIHFPKNNYFAYRWRIKDHFNNSIERQKFHLGVMGGGQDRTLMNNKILGLYKSRYNSTTKSDLIADLAQKTLAFLEERRQTQKKISETEVVLTTHVRRLLERCYNTLFAFATELNTLLGLSELFITSTDPILTNQLNGKPTVTSKLLARLSTNSYSLFMEGTKDRIKFFVMPVEELLSLKTDIAMQYNTIACFKAKLEADKSVTWWHDEDQLNDDMVDICCVELLNSLIEATKNRLVPPTPEDDKGNKETFSLFDPEPWNVEAMMRHHLQNGKAREVPQTAAEELERISERIEEPPAATGFEYDEANKRWQHISETPKYRGTKPKSETAPSPELSLPASYDFQNVFENLSQVEESEDAQVVEVSAPVLPSPDSYPASYSQTGWEFTSEPAKSEFEFTPSMEFDTFNFDQSVITTEREPVVQKSVQLQPGPREQERTKSKKAKAKTDSKSETKKESSADRRNRRRQTRNLRRKRNSK